MGNYNVKYIAQNDNYAQALYFVAADGDNNYKIKFIDADGTDRYISTGKVHGGNDAQSRTVTDPNEALVINVRRNGQYIKLYNTAANNYIGSQDQGVFTVDSHTDMVVVETTSEKAVSRTVAPGKYSTIVLPYAVASVSGAYSAEVKVNGDVVELTEVNSLEANKAYILGEGEYNFSGVSTAFKEPAANGCLTGVLTDTQVPVDAYVLQTQNEVQKFFKVVADNQPTLSANKAYLTAPASPVKEFGFAGGTATAIEALDALVSGQAKIYDLNGRQLQKLQKGVNIVNGVKVLVK